VAALPEARRLSASACSSALCSRAASNSASSCGVSWPVPVAGQAGSGERPKRVKQATCRPARSQHGSFSGASTWSLQASESMNTQAHAGLQQTGKSGARAYSDSGMHRRALEWMCTRLSWPMLGALALACCILVQGKLNGIALAPHGQYAGWQADEMCARCKSSALCSKPSEFVISHEDRGKRNGFVQQVCQALARPNLAEVCMHAVTGQLFTRLHHARHHAAAREMHT